MKKNIRLVLSILLAGLLAGCGPDSDSKDAKKKDRIERVGDGASTLGYDGEAIKKGLREVEGLDKERDKELEKVLGD